jgi:hypothetical protein
VVEERQCAAEVHIFSPCRIVENEGVGVVRFVVLLTESAKEQDTARRTGKWCFPGGRTVPSRALVSCCWESKAIVSDRERRRRSKWSCVEGHRSGV